MYIYIYIKGATACNRLDAINSRETKACHVDGTKRERERGRKRNIFHELPREDVLRIARRVCARNDDDAKTIVHDNRKKKFRR